MQDATMLTFLLYCGHGMGKRTPSGGGHYSLVNIVRGDTIHGGTRFTPTTLNKQGPKLSIVIDC